MTFYKYFFGEANWLRKNMRGHYDGSMRAFTHFKLGGSTHENALAGALNSWRIDNGMTPSCMGERLRIVNAEVLPFNAMEKAASLKALAEYAVYQKLPAKAKTEWLAAQINSALKQPFDDALLYAVSERWQDRIGWWGLVDPAIRERVEADMQITIQDARCA